MPTYTFKNIETDEVFDKLMKISELDNFLKENTHIIQIVGGASTFIYDAGTNIKVSDGFKDRMKEIKKKYTINNIPDY